MPSTQTAQKKPKSKAEMNHEIKLLALKDQVAANQHERSKEAVGLKQKEIAMTQAAERESHERELELAMLDPAVVQMQGLQRLQKSPHSKIAGHVMDAITSIADIHDDAHQDLTDNDNEYRRAKVDSKQVKVKGVSDAKTRKKPGVIIDPDTDDQYRSAQDSLTAQRARLIQPRGLRRSRAPVKKKLRESVDNQHVWFTGTYTPFSAHHAKAVKQTMEQYGDKPFHIGITGKQRAPDFELPEIEADQPRDEYLGHTMIRYNAYLKTNTPIELKMAVAKAAHPDLAPHMKWVRDAFGASIDGTHAGPQEGDIIHSDTLSNIAPNSPAYSPISNDSSWLHQKTGTIIKSPKMVLDAEGNKENTTPLRLTLITAHAGGGLPDHHINSLHSQLLGVPMDHPGIQQSRRMFDWMGQGWNLIQAAAHKKYDAEKGVSESRLDLKSARFPRITGDVREHAIGAYALMQQDHLASTDDYFDEKESFHQHAKKRIASYNDLSADLEGFRQMIRVGKNDRINAQLPFLPSMDIEKVRYMRGGSLKHIKQLNPMAGRTKVTIKEDRRHAAGVGERLLRAQSLKSVGKRIGAKAPPPTNENTLLRRAKRAARYDLRKKLAPNYRNLSTGQKQDIDERVAKHADFKRLVDGHYAQYKKKYAEKAHASSHNKKPEHTK